MQMGMVEALTVAQAFRSGHRNMGDRWSCAENGGTVDKRVDKRVVNSSSKRTELTSKNGFG